MKKIHYTAAKMDLIKNWTVLNYSKIKLSMNLSKDKDQGFLETKVDVNIK